MSEPGSLKSTQRRQKALALMSKMAALLGLAALGFLLTRSAMMLPVGWVVVLVAVIQFSVACSPATGSASNREAVPVRSMDCYRYPADSSYRRRTLSSKEN